MTADQMKDFEREIWRSHIRASVEEMQRSVSLEYSCVCIGQWKITRELFHALRAIILLM